MSQSSVGSRGEVRIGIVAFLALVVGMIVAASVSRGTLRWPLVAAVMLAFLVLLGVERKGRWAGILINERNLMSISRFQVLLWTLIVGSAYFTMAMVRIHEGVPDPLSIQADEKLWGLLGISFGSLAGSSMILSRKKAKTPANPDGDVEATVKKLTGRGDKTDADEVKKGREGILYSNPDPEDARFSDMFEGDEVRDTAHVDVAKVQMFLFTLVAAVSYAALLHERIGSGDPAQMASFPALDQGLIAILGISHLGYLGNKAVDTTKTV